MKKFPFSSAGVNGLQDALYSLGDAELRAEAESLAADACAWIAAHLELEVHQLECLRCIKEEFMLMLGWSLATALLGRRPVSLKHIKDKLIGGANQKSCILYSHKLSAHFLGENISAIGEFDITYTEAIR